MVPPNHPGLKTTPGAGSRIEFFGALVNVFVFGSDGFDPLKGISPMARKIEWIPVYTVGRKDLDRQHKYLFQLVDEIPATLEHGEVNSIVMKLFKYTREHFTNEERILAGINYPQLEEHKIHHINLISQLTEYGGHGFSEEKDLFDFREFAFNWITDHILQEDHQYLRFVKENKLDW